MSSIMQILPEKTEYLASHYISLLVVASERAVRECCKEVAEDLRFRVHLADNAAAALRILDARAIDLVLLDSVLGGRYGLELLRRIRETHPEAQVVLLNGNATADSVLAAMKSGAWDCLRKPFHLDELTSLLERAINQLRFSQEGRAIRESLRNQSACAGLLGRSREIDRLQRIVAKVVPGRHPVLIQGETGTAKESVARAIHFHGPFHDRPFIPVDCGSLTPLIMEAELFGSLKNPPSAHGKPKDGLFVMAQRGTLFLDEVSKMPLDLQAALVRAMQEKEIWHTGLGKPIPFDARIIAATSCDLDAAMTEGTFRRDLHARLNIVNLRLPALRERREDIRVIAEHFVGRFSRDKEPRLSIGAEAMKVLCSYDWPGNVRELESCLQRAVALAAGPVLEARDLPAEIRHARVVTLPPIPYGKPGIVPLAQLEREAILNALHELNGDRITAAQLLGIGKTTLYRKLKEYKIVDHADSQNRHAAVTRSVEMQ
jgi:two-component system response regulator HydG